LDDLVVHSGSSGQTYVIYGARDRVAPPSSVLELANRTITGSGDFLVDIGQGRPASEFRQGQGVWTLDGVDDHLRVASSSSLETVDFTFETRLQFEELPTTKQFIASRMREVSGENFFDGWGVMIEPVGDGFELSAVFGANSGGFNRVAVDFDPVVGQTYRVATSYRRTGGGTGTLVGEMTLFVDGVEAASLENGGTVLNEQDPILLGANGILDDTNPKDFFRGKVFSARLWDRALSVEQLQQSVDDEFTEIEAARLFDLQATRSSRSTAVDLAGNGNDGTLLGGTDVTGNNFTFASSPGTLSLTVRGNSANSWYRFTTLGDGQAGDHIAIRDACPASPEEGDCGLTQFAATLYDRGLRQVSRPGALIDMTDLPAGEYFLFVQPQPGADAAQYDLEMLAPLAGYTLPASDRDTIRGGDGEDTIFGNGGLDRLYGESGNETFYAEEVEIRDLDPLRDERVPANSDEDGDGNADRAGEHSGNRGTITNPVVYAANTIHSIGDVALVIAESLGVPVTDSSSGQSVLQESIHASDIASLSQLDAGNQTLSNLEGLEFAVNVERLSFTYSGITDLSPISMLPNLRDAAIALDSAPASTSSDTAAGSPVSFETADQELLEGTVLILSDGSEVTLTERRLVGRSVTPRSATPAIANTPSSKGTNTTSAIPN
ncbi:MAG: LamG-like jellyroll fold domain-containing protein, partial [Planctomycetota bacterium]